MAKPPPRLPSSTVQAMAAAHTADWPWARQQYEQGLMTLPDLARATGVTTSRMGAIVAKEGWTKDPAARAKAQEALKAEQVKNEVLAQARVEAITIQVQSKVLTGHRKDIAAARKVATALLSELAELTQNIEVFDRLGEALRAEDDKGRDRLNDAYRKVLKLPERSATLNNLAMALKTLILLERQAFFIMGTLDDPEATRPQAEVVKGLDAIMSKFDAVLAQQVPSTKELVIVDVTPAHSRSTAISAL